MNKEDVVRNLLLMHCEKCNGMVFGCRGCTKEEEINFIMSNLDEPEEKTVVDNTALVFDLIEKSMPEEKPKKKKK